MKKKCVILNWKYIVYLIVVSVLFYAACKSTEKKAAPEKPVPVKVSSITRQAVSVPVHTSGRLTPGVQSKLSFKTGGIIGRIMVDEGQAVKKGQLLASLVLSEIDARVAQAKNGFEKAKRDKERVQNLYNDRAATLEQFQDVTTAFDVAKSNLDIARFNLKYSKIHAPANGKILKRLMEVNEMTGAGYPVFVFGSTDSRWVVKVGISLRDVVKLNPDDRAEVTFDAYPERRFDARVTEISEAVDPASGTCEVELEMADPAQPIKWIAGFIAAVDIFPAVTKTYAMIPMDALVEAEGGEGFVFIVKDGKARKVKVKIAHLAGGHALAADGDERISEVVTGGAPYLTDGTVVDVVK
jgi:RND family efflux transporter MFP subunit